MAFVTQRARSIAQFLVRSHNKLSLSVEPENSTQSFLELKIVNHLYSCDKAVQPAQHSGCTPEDIFSQSLNMVRWPRKRTHLNTASIAQAALDKLPSTSTASRERHLLLVSAAFNARGPLQADIQSAIVSALEMSNSTDSTVEILRLLFVAGLTKTRLAPATWQTLQHRLHCRADQLSRLDLVSLCSATYRCSARITSRRLQALIVADACRLADDGQQHTDLLVALVKALRLARVRSPAVLAALERRVGGGADRLPLPTAAHLAACFCAPPVGDAALLATLETLLARRLETVPAHRLAALGGGRSPVPDGRPKDVARLLHVFSQLGHTPCGHTVRLVVEHMRHWPSGLHMADALLSLAVLGCYPGTLLARVSHQQVIQQMKGAQQSRRRGRLALLLLAASLETSLQLPHVDGLQAEPASPPPPPDGVAAQRPQLRTLLREVRRALPSAAVRLAYPVPHTSASVVALAADGQRHCFELLDADVTVRQLRDVLASPEPRAVSSAGEAVSSDGHPASAIGLVRLKMRLATKLGYRVHCWRVVGADHS